jgi:hypothetical protein
MTGSTPDAVLVMGISEVRGQAGKKCAVQEKRCAVGESDAQQEENFGPYAQDSQIRRSGADLVRLTPDFQGQAHKIGEVRRGAQAGKLRNSSRGQTHGI